VVPVLKVEGGMNEVVNFIPGWIKDLERRRKNHWWVRERKHKKVEMAMMKWAWLLSMVHF
jgi:hypothetical protein